MRVAADDRQLTICLTDTFAIIVRIPAERGPAFPSAPPPPNPFIRPLVGHFTNEKSSWTIFDCVISRWRLRTECCGKGKSEFSRNRNIGGKCTKKSCIICRPSFTSLHTVMRLGLPGVIHSLHPYILKKKHRSDFTNWIIWVLSQRERGTAVAQWLRRCATNRKFAGSIPTAVNGFLIDINSFRSHYGPGVDSASNRNEYQEYFFGGKKRPVRKADNFTTILGHCHAIWEP